MHVLQSSGGKIEDLIGDIADGLLDLGIFVDGLSLQGDSAAVRPVNAGHVANDGGLARAVGAYQSVDSSLGHRHIQVIQGFEGAEGFGEVFDFNHVLFPLS